MTITLDAYERDVFRTALAGATLTEDLSLVGHKLAGEVAELTSEIFLGAHRRDEMTNEAGDVLYYLVFGACRLGLRFRGLVKLANQYPIYASDATRIIRLMVAAGAYNDAIGKVAYHKHPLAASPLREQLARAFSCLRAILDAEKISLDAVMAANIEKRLIRYPTGFSTLRSLHRRDEQPQYT